MYRATYQIGFYWKDAQYGVDPMEPEIQSINMSIKSLYSWTYLLLFLFVCLVKWVYGHPGCLHHKVLDLYSFSETLRIQLPHFLRAGMWSTWWNKKNRFRQGKKTSSRGNSCALLGYSKVYRNADSLGILVLIADSTPISPVLNIHESWV